MQINNLGMYTYRFTPPNCSVVRVLLKSTKRYTPIRPSRGRLKFSAYDHSCLRAGLVLSHGHTSHPLHNSGPAVLGAPDHETMTSSRGYKYHATSGPAYSQNRSAYPHVTNDQCLCTAPKSNLETRAISYVHTNTLN